MFHVLRFLVFSFLFIFCCNFLLAQPEWVSSLPFEGDARANAVSFTLDGKGYVGLGANDSTLFKDFWRYDPATKGWTKIADFGGTGRRSAVAFVLNGKAYVGLGQSGLYPNFTNHKDFWEYDPIANSWTETTAFAGSARYKSVAFTQGGKGFVMLGRDDAGYPKDVWVFDPVSKQWTAKNNFTDEGRIGAFVFSLNSKIYVGHGVNYEGGSTNIQNNYLVYDDDADSWSEVDILPSKITIRNDIFYFSLNGKGYFGGGINGNETWEFDPAANTWTEMDEFGSNSSYNLSSSTAFVINNAAHIATGYYSTDIFTGKYVSDFFKFGEGLITPERPDDVLAKIISTTSIKVTWRDNSDNEAGFIVEKSKFSPGNYKVIGVLGPDETSFIDEDLELYTTYFYRIRAFHDGISGAPYSDQIYFEDPYKAPSGLKTYDNAATRIKLAWNDNAHLEDGYIVERSVNDTLNWTVLDSVAADVTQYIDASISPQTSVFYRVKGFYGSETTAYSNKEQAYLEETGDWLKTSEFPGTARTEYFSFVIGNKLYLGAGKTKNFEMLKDFWSYDLIAGTWKQLSDFGGGIRNLLAGFSINGKGYAGMGSNTSGKYKDFWAYNPATDSWTKKSDFSGVANYGPASFVINNKGYLLSGLDANNNQLNTFWEYNPTTDSWIQKQNFPGTGRREAIGTTSNGLGYIGLGISFIINDKHDDLYAYNPATNTWEAKTGISADYEHWIGAHAVVQDGQIFAGTGTVFKSGYGNPTDRMWRYDIATDQWTPWGRFPLKTAGHASFMHNGTMYALGDNKGKLEIYRHLAGSPSAPDNFTVEAKLDTAFLQWYDQSAKETGYILERKTNTSSYLAIDTLPADVEQYTDLLPEDGKKYYYRLTAINNEGSSAYVEAASGFVPLRAPDSVGVSPISGNSLEITWVNKSQNAEKIEVFMSENDTQQFERVGLRDISGSYWNGSLKENTNYYFKVRATIEYVVTSDFVYTSGKTLLYGPEEFLLKMENGGIALSWKDASKYETAYQIERSIGDEESFELIHTTAANATSFVDTDFEEGISVYYRIKAISADNSSAYSKVVDVFTYLAPTGLAATLVTADSISFSWKNHSQIAPYVQLKRGYAADSLSAYPFTFTATLDSDEERYTDDFLKENTLYRYFVQAHDYDNYSSPSSIILVHTLLNAPSNLAIGNTGNGGLQLQWQNNTEAVDYSVVIEMAQGGGSFAEIKTLQEPADTYLLENIVPGKNDQFRIKIFNDKVASVYSNVVNASVIVTGLPDESDNHLEIVVSPNPAGNYLKVHSEKRIEEITIMHLSGKTVKKFRPQKDEVYDISTLPSGVYLLSAIVGDKVNIVKFIKQ